jgi:hypothetical protein
MQSTHLEQSFGVWTRTMQLQLEPHQVAVHFEPLNDVGLPEL